jgi:hypothetical protein
MIANLNQTVSVIHISPSNPMCAREYNQIHPLNERNRFCDGALFLGTIPLPGLVIFRREDGGTSVYNLNSAVHVITSRFFVFPRWIKRFPFHPVQLVNYPWQKACAILDDSGPDGDDVRIRFNDDYDDVVLENPMRLPRVRAVLEFCGREIAQHAREERWRQLVNALFMGFHPRLGQNSFLRHLDTILLQSILKDAIQNPVDRKRFFRLRVPRIGDHGLN